MKISVIMGIFHMTIGIVMKGTNAAFHGHWVDLITEVIFGLTIFYFLFGWMDLMIISKWFVPVNIENTNINMDYWDKNLTLYPLGTEYSAYCGTDPSPCSGGNSPASFPDN